MKFRDELKNLVGKDVKVAMAHNHRVLGHAEIYSMKQGGGKGFPTMNQEPKVPDVWRTEGYTKQNLI